MGIAMSRYSGGWVAMKTIADTVESTATVDLANERFDIVTPTDFVIPEGGSNYALARRPLDPGPPAAKL